MQKEIDSYASAWNLVEIERLAETPFGGVYKAQRNGDTVVLKIYIGEGIKDGRRGAELLQICKGDGVVGVLEADEGAILMEYCDGQELAKTVTKETDSDATKIIAGILNKIHAFPVPEDHKFATLYDRFAPLYIMAKKNNPTNVKDLFVKASDLAKKLLSEQQDVSLLHGDLHHGNVLHDSKKGWLAIDPKGYVGDRANDAANMLLHPWNLEDLVRNEDRFLQRTTILSEDMGIDSQKIINYSFVEVCVFAAWYLENGTHSQHAFAMAKIIEPFVETKRNQSLTHTSR